MMNRVEMNEKMMELVNGGRPSNSPVNPYSINAPWSTKGEKKENEAANRV